jgi:LuxR family transcriptional regulator of spore coat protein
MSEIRYYILIKKGLRLPLCLQLVHIANVMQKLAVKGRSQAVVELVRLGELKI